MQTRIVVLFYMMALGMSIGHAQELSLEDKEVLKQRALEKIYDFVSYLPEIAAKKHKSKEEQQLALKYIETALGLFIGEGNDYECEDLAGNKWIHEAAKIQVISHQHKKAPQPVKRFLNRLMVLPYQSIQIDSAEIFLVDKVYHCGDGKYIGKARLVPVLFSIDKPLFFEECLYKKEIYVNIEVDTIFISNDEKLIVMPAKLGNIYVSQSSKL